MAGTFSLYDRVAMEASAVVIRRYSTSFGLACRLLGAGVRQDVENIYALVRLADEIVDGVAASAHLPGAEIGRVLTALERETEQATSSGYSANLIVHAFAITARETGIGTELTEPFFESMRTDLSRTSHTDESFDRYVYGSAEVVGLMCLRAFLKEEDVPDAEHAILVDGACHLGAAFQKINFLRDLAADFGDLGRSYFPGIEVGSFGEAEKERILDGIDEDLAIACSTLPLLPPSSRKAVVLAQGLFAELTRRLRETPADVLCVTRIRVPNAVKIRIAAVVIGAGISGLAASALLAREGYSVTVLEKQESVGGRAGVWSRDGFRFDTGPSWYLMPEVFEHFFALLGTSVAEQFGLTRLDPGYRVFFEGEPAPVDIAADRDANIELFESLEPGSGTKLVGYLDSAAETYELAKQYFLYSTFDDLKPLLKSPVLSRSPRLVRLLTESLAGFAGRTVHDPRLQQILGYPAVFLGSSPYATPSMYHLMSHLDLEAGVLYPQGGFGRVIASIERIARDAGVDIRTGATATRIVLESDEQEKKAAEPRDVYDYETTEFDTNVIDRDELRRVLAGEEPSYRPVATAEPDEVPDAALGLIGGGAANRVGGVHFTDSEGRAHSLEADVVVSAADLRHTETTMLLPELQTYPESYWEKKTAGPGAVLVFLGVRGELPELAHHSLFFTKDWRDTFGKIFGKGRFGRKTSVSVPDPASIYVSRTSATDPTAAPAGHENLFLLVPVPADPGIGRGGDDGGGDPRVERIADAAIAQVAEWAGIPDLAARIVLRKTVGPADFASELNSWKGTALGPAHTLGQSAFFRTGNVSKKVDGLFYSGGSTIPGIGLPMCLISAELVIKRLRGDTSAGALPEPPARRAAVSAPVPPSVPVPPAAPEPPTAPEPSAAPEPPTAPVPPTAPDGPLG
jgi:phytoene dehydrogenase-like protein/phytoene/squalene synthetase